ncbi:MAG: DUF853 family protein, partial [Lachnospiraceae bacterium]|nr:DUF853 family protein [Lachnospiraceae bacterium]
DEAHILFDHASKDLLMRIEQTVKLIRSKGVGIFFVTQNPGDIPDGIMSQLGNKIQHALHAYSPNELRLVKAAEDTYRPNPDFNTAEVIQNLATGEAIISTLDQDGVPGMVERCFILPPQSFNGAADDMLRDSLIKGSLLYSRYANAFDRDSAYEFLQRMGLEREAQAQKEARDLEEAKAQEAARKQAEREAAAAQKQAEREAIAAQRQAEREAAAIQREAEREAKRKKTEIGRVAKTVTGTVGRQIGNSIGASVGGSFGKTLGGNIGAQLGRSILGTLFKM